MKVKTEKLAGMACDIIDQLREKDAKQEQALDDLRRRVAELESKPKVFMGVDMGSPEGSKSAMCYWVDDGDGNSHFVVPKECYGKEGTVTGKYDSDEPEPYPPKFKHGDIVDTPKGEATFQYYGKDESATVVVTRNGYHCTHLASDVTPHVEKTTGMNHDEAEAALERGEKIRRACWRATYLVKFDGVILDFSGGAPGRSSVRQCNWWQDDCNTDWEIVK